MECKQTSAGLDIRLRGHQEITIKGKYVVVDSSLQKAVKSPGVLLTKTTSIYHVNRMIINHNLITGQFVKVTKEGSNHE